MKRPIALAAAALITAATLSACTPAPAPTSSGMTDDEILALPKVELVVPVNTSPYWDEVKRGAFAAGKDLKVNIFFNGPDDPADSAGYLKLLRAAMNHKPAGIGVASQTASAATIPDVLKPAADAKIQIVAVGSSITGYDGAIATVMSNSQWLGENAAKQLGVLVKSKGSVAVLTNGSDPATKVRADAFSAYVKKSLPNMKVVTVADGGQKRADTKKAAQQVLTDNPKLVGFFGTDAVTTLGIADALKDAKKATAKVVGVDADPDEVALVKDGTIAGAFAQNAFNIGYQTVRLIVDASNGTMPKDKTVFSEVVWYTKANMKDPAVVQILGATP